MKKSKKILRTIYRILKPALGVFIVLLYGFIDIVFVMAREWSALALFAFLELFIAAFGILLTRYINQIVLFVSEKNGRVKIETFGKTHTSKLTDIRIIKGNFNYYIMKFGGTKLKIFPSDKEVNDFLKKHFVRIN